MCLVWLRKHQVHQFFTGVDTAKAVGELHVAAKLILRLRGFAITCTVTKNVGGWSLFFVKIFSQTHRWGYAWTWGSTVCVKTKKKPQPSNYSDTSYIWQNVFVEYDGCLFTCVCAYIYIAYSVLSLCCVVSYSVFFSWRIYVKFSGKRGKWTSTSDNHLYDYQKWHIFWERSLDYAKALI